MANVLTTEVELSALVCTRESGALKSELSDQVLFYTANKTSVFDLKAFLRLRAFMKLNNINIIHAHSTSFFWGTLLKLTCSHVKLIWHDHYGMSSQLKDRNKFLITLSSYFFDQVIVVNNSLKEWSLEHLKCALVTYLPNFTSDTLKVNLVSSFKFKGHTEAFKIVHVANLRPQKDHITALKAIKILNNQKLNITYHVIGAYNAGSEYFQSVKSFIENKSLEKNVFIYGSQSGIPHILNQANLGLLSSISEGLPVSLLEYIKAELPVVLTDVGQSKAIVGEFGQVVEPEHEIQLANAIKQVFENKDHAKQKAVTLKQAITETYDSKKIIRRLVDIYHLSLQKS